MSLVCPERITQLKDLLRLWKVGVSNNLPRSTNIKILALNIVLKIARCEIPLPDRSLCFLGCVRVYERLVSKLRQDVMNTAEKMYTPTSTELTVNNKNLNIHADLNIDLNPQQSHEQFMEQILNSTSALTAKFNEQPVKQTGKNPRQTRSSKRLADAENVKVKLQPIIEADLEKQNIDPESSDGANFGNDFDTNGGNQDDDDYDGNNNTNYIDFTNPVHQQEVAQAFESFQKMPAEQLSELHNLAMQLQDHNVYSDQHDLSTSNITSTSFLDAVIVRDQDNRGVPPPVPDPNIILNHNISHLDDGYNNLNDNDNQLLNFSINDDNNNNDLYDTGLLSFSDDNLLNNNHHLQPSKTDPNNLFSSPIDLPSSHDDEIGPHSNDLSTVFSPADGEINAGHFQEMCDIYFNTIGPDMNMLLDLDDNKTQIAPQNDQPAAQDVPSTVPEQVNDDETVSATTTSAAIASAVAAAAATAAATAATTSVVASALPTAPTSTRSSRVISKKKVNTFSSLDFDQSIAINLPLYLSPTTIQVQSGMNQHTSTIKKNVEKPKENESAMKQNIASTNSRLSIIEPLPPYQLDSSSDNSEGFGTISLHNDSLVRVRDTKIDKPIAYNVTGISFDNPFAFEKSSIDLGLNTSNNNDINNILDDFDSFRGGDDDDDDNDGMWNDISFNTSTISNNNNATIPGISSLFGTPLRRTINSTPVKTSSTPNQNNEIEQEQKSSDTALINISALANAILLHQQASLTAKSTENCNIKPSSIVFGTNDHKLSVFSSLQRPPARWYGTTSSFTNPRRRYVSKQSNNATIKSTLQNDHVVNINNASIVSPSVSSPKRRRLASVISQTQTQLENDSDNNDNNNNNNNNATTSHLFQHDQQNVSVFSQLSPDDASFGNISFSIHGDNDDNNDFDANNEFIDPSPTSGVVHAVLDAFYPSSVIKTPITTNKQHQQQNQQLQQQQQQQNQSISPFNKFSPLQHRSPIHTPLMTTSTKKKGSFLSTFHLGFTPEENKVLRNVAEEAGLVFDDSTFNNNNNNINNNYDLSIEENNDSYDILIDPTGIYSTEQTGVLHPETTSTIVNSIVNDYSSSALHTQFIEQYLPSVLSRHHITSHTQTISSLHNMSSSLWSICPSPQRQFSSAILFDPPFKYNNKNNNNNNDINNSDNIIDDNNIDNDIKESSKSPRRRKQPLSTTAASTTRSTALSHHDVNKLMLPSISSQPLTSVLMKDLGSDFVDIFHSMQTSTQLSEQSSLLQGDIHIGTQLPSIINEFPTNSSSFCSSMTYQYASYMIFQRDTRLLTATWLGLLSRITSRQNEFTQGQTYALQMLLPFITLLDNTNNTGQAALFAQNMMQSQHIASFLITLSLLNFNNNNNNNINIPFSDQQHHTSAINNTSLVTNTTSQFQHPYGIDNIYGNPLMIQTKTAGIQSYIQLLNGSINKNMYFYSDSCPLIDHVNTSNLATYIDSLYQKRSIFLRIHSITPQVKQLLSLFSKFSPIQITDTVLNNNINNNNLSNLPKDGNDDDNNIASDFDDACNFDEFSPIEESFNLISSQDDDHLHDNKYNPNISMTLSKDHQQHQQMDNLFANATINTFLAEQQFTQHSDDGFSDHNDFNNVGGDLSSTNDRNENAPFSLQANDMDNMFLSDSNSNDQNIGVEQLEFNPSLYFPKELLSLSRTLSQLSPLEDQSSASESSTDDYNDQYSLNLRSDDNSSDRQFEILTQSSSLPVHGIEEFMTRNAAPSTVSLGVDTQDLYRNLCQIASNNHNLTMTFNQLVEYKTKLLTASNNIHDQKAQQSSTNIQVATTSFFLILFLVKCNLVALRQKDSYAPLHITLLAPNAILE